MLVAPTSHDLQVVLRTAGVALGWFSAAMAALAGLALSVGDVNTATAIAVGAAPGLILGVMARQLPSDRPVTWTLGMVAAVATWGGCAVVGSVPLWLSGHYVGYHHALFDAISGITNTGLTLVADLDHLARPLIAFRALLELAGGFAFVVVATALFAAPTALESSLAGGSQRAERVLPRTGRVLRRARLLLGGLFGIGVVVVATMMLVAGVPVATLAWHAVSIAAAAATTGGFAPQSDGMAAYHSAGVEAATIVLMVGAATSLGVWVMASRGRFRAILHDLDARVFAGSLLVTLASIVFGLARAGTFDTVAPLARHGLFLTVAAATTTGLSTVDPVVLVNDYGTLAPAAMVAAMTIGGMFASMASGVGALRVGLLGKGVVTDMRELLRPEGAVTRQSWWRLGERELVTDAHIRSAATIVALALAAILAGAMALLWTDPTIDLRVALFSATSAVTNTGLDMPALRPDLGVAVTLGHAALMLLGRLQWLAVFAAGGFLFAALRGHR